MNPYTSMWAGSTEQQDFHLILLDNGRTATLADPRGRAALRCIRCSACLNVCPVYQRTGGHAYGSVYPGPIGAVLSPQLTGVAANASLPFASSLCGACYEVCPDPHRHPDHARSPARRRGRQRTPPRTVPRAVDHGRSRDTMADSHRWTRALRVGRLGRFASRRRVLPPPLSAWVAARDLPEPPKETFRDWWTREGQR